MKAFTRTALVVAGVSLVAGLTLMVTGAAINRGKQIHMYYDHGFKIDSEGKVQEMPKTVVEDFKDIIVDVPASDIKFIESDEYAVEYKIRAIEVTCESKDGTLKVSTAKKKFDINLGFFSWDSEDYYVYVYYPKGADFGTVDLDSSAGDVLIEEGFDCDLLKLDLSAGDAKIKHVNGALEVDMSAGDFEAEKCEFGKCEFDLSAGDVDLLYCTIGGGELDMSAGDFDAKGLTLTASFDIDMSAGSVDIEFVEGQEIGYDFDLSAGSATINGEKRGDEFTMKDGYDIVLTADMSAGSIDIINK